MRVLFSAAPLVGHVVPLLDLAGTIQAAGHEVRFATNPAIHHLVDAVGVTPVAAGMSSAEMTGERRRRWPETDRQPATVWAQRMFAQVMAPSTLTDLLDLVGHWRPTVLVHEESEYAGPVAAAAAGVPWVTHAFGSPLRPAHELVELEELAKGLWRSCGLAVPPAAGLYAQALVNPCPPILEDRASGADVIWPIRPRPLSGRGVQTTGDAYVGFGTVPHFAEAPAELDAAVRACAAHGMRVVVTAPTSELRDHLAAIAPELVEAHEFVSLPDVLANCKVVISHAGAGTVLASLRAGVPLVLVPRGTPSQVRMADACQRAGVGRHCEPTTLAAALDDVLGDPSIAEGAAGASRQIASMPDAKEVMSRIETLASG